MTRLIAHNLAIYNHETLSKNAKIGSKFYHIPNTTPKLPNTSTILPKWQYFSKSGHTGKSVHWSLDDHLK